jgi:hypothetical protein
MNDSKHHGKQALIDRLERHRATAAQRLAFTAWRVTRAANKHRAAALQILHTKQHRLRQRQLSASALHTWRSVSTAYTAQARAASAAAVSTAVAQRLALLRERRQLSAVLCGKFLLLQTMQCHYVPTERTYFSIRSTACSSSQTEYPNARALCSISNSTCHDKPSSPIAAFRSSASLHTKYRLLLGSLCNSLRYFLCA